MNVWVDSNAITRFINRSTLEIAIWNSLRCPSPLVLQHSDSEQFGFGDGARDPEPSQHVKQVAEGAADRDPSGAFGHRPHPFGDPDPQAGAQSRRGRGDG